MSLIGKILRLVIERRGRQRTLPEWHDELESSGLTVLSRMQNCQSSEKDREISRHFVGIERWGQQRLKVFLGDDLVMEEYDGYAPDDDSDMVTLCHTFEETRKATVELAEKLKEADIPEDQTVPHNDLGGLTVRGWLSYIDGHTLRDSEKISAYK